MASYSSNQNCVEKLLVLSETHSIIATEDIVDEHGIKLLARGATVSRALQDRLLMRKLKAPLESSLSVHDGVTMEELMQGALDLIDNYPALERIAGSRSARAILREGKSLRIPPPLCLLMTCERGGDPDSFRRTLMVAAICAAIASELNAPGHDAQLALVAAVLHDIGEIYINPEYLHPQRRLSPHEWKHVATHPCVGQLIIRNLTSLPSAVGCCVAQHHERQDGSGYPAQLSRSEQHRLSAWLSVADATAALIDRGESEGERIALALRIVPEEFDRQAADVLIRCLRTDAPEVTRVNPDEVVETPQILINRLQSATVELQAVVANDTSKLLHAICNKLLGLLDGFAKSLRATGVLDVDRLTGEDLQDAGLQAEIRLVVSEVTWRMRSLARNLFLHVDALKDEAVMLLVQPAMDLLDGPIALSSPEES
jgi:hypothetical protein